MQLINIVYGTTNISSADPFDYAGSSDVMSHSDKGYVQFLSMAGDWYKLVLTISIIAAILTVSWILIKIAVTKQGKKRAELKDIMNWKLILLIVIESMGTILSVVTKLAMSFAK